MYSFFFPLYNSKYKVILFAFPHSFSFFLSFQIIKTDQHSFREYNYNTISMLFKLNL